MNPNHFSSLFGSDSTRSSSTNRNGLHYSDLENLEQLYSSKTTSKLMYYCQDLHSQKKAILNGIPPEYELILTIISSSTVPYNVQNVLTINLVMSLLLPTNSLLLDLVLVHTEGMDEADLALSLNVSPVENCMSS
ncbi:hypothetical protein Gorai_022825 [Gossypium raimondii]|uniref:Uncharacterized protein n=1 Tax=Gossypium raimondii TaxID=29730 RepID=A0A7J8NUP3_GOSRA|nr:hypothetical protein [Gossypium raimondii]